MFHASEPWWLPRFQCWLGPLGGLVQTLSYGDWPEGMTVNPPINTNQCILISLFVSPHILSSQGGRVVNIFESDLPYIFRHNLFSHKLFIYLFINYNYLVNKKFLMFCALQFEHFPISLYKDFLLKRLI